MKMLKPVLGALLAAAVLVSAVGCASMQSEESIPETVQTQPAELPAPVIPAEHYLHLAEALVEKEDYSAAIAILDEAVLICDDPRLSQLLQELEPYRSVKLTVDMLVQTPGMEGYHVQINSISAEALPSQMVRYYVQYSCPDGMYITLLAPGLFYVHEETTAGGGVFIFELKTEDVKRLEGLFQLSFSIPDVSQTILKLHTRWPGEPAVLGEETPQEAATLLTYETDYQFYNAENPGCVQVQSLTATNTEDSVHFTLRYIAEQGQELSARLWHGEDFDLFPLDAERTTGGEGVLEFDLPKSTIAENNSIVISFDSDGIFTTVDIPFPLRVRRTQGTPVGEALTLNWHVERGFQSAAYTIHGCTLQKLDNGYARYTLDMTLPEGTYVTATAAMAFSAETIISTTYEGGRQTFSFDVDGEKLAESLYVTLLISKGGDTNLLLLPSRVLYAGTDSEPVAEEEALEFVVFMPLGDAFQVHGCTVQALDNNYYRYQLDYTAPGGLRFSVFDPPDAQLVSYMFFTKPEGGRDTFVFDIPGDTVEKLSSLTFLVYQYGKTFGVEVFDVAGSGNGPEAVEVKVISFR